MDIQKEREAFEEYIISKHKNRSPLILTQRIQHGFSENYIVQGVQDCWETWQAVKAQAVPAQLDVNSILHDIDCYFDNGLSNTERTANNLLQSIYGKLSGEVKAQEPAND